MKKYLDTSRLITYQSGNNKGHYDWINNIGKELYFEYDDINGIIKILDYEIARPQGKITLQYKENIMTTSTSNLLQLKIPSLFNKEKHTRKYTYNIGDIIDKGYQKSKIISKTKANKLNSERSYELECQNCKYIYITRESRLSSCPVCGIRSTFSERFIFSIFIQSKTEFEVQKEFEWLENRWYDVYLPKYNAIVEIHGLQHYEPVKLKDREHKPIEEVFNECVKSDKIKQEAAINNGLKFYVIDAREQNNLFKEAQKILDFIDFSQVSELECGRFAVYNSVKDICSLWNSGKSIEYISQKLNKSVGVVQSKLRLGNKYKLCVYDKDINMKNHKITNPNQKQKKKSKYKKKTDKAS